MSESKGADQSDPSRRVARTLVWFREFCGRRERDALRSYSCTAGLAICTCREEGIDAATAEKLRPGLVKTASSCEK
jgi:hypothetical protein